MGAYSDYVKRYLIGYSAKETADKFESLEKSIALHRSTLSELSGRLKEVASDGDAIHKSVADGNVPTAEDVESLMSDSSRTNEYILDIVKGIKLASLDLKKAQVDMERLIKSTPDIAKIIVARADDEKSEQAFRVIADAYASREIGHQQLIKAYKLAKSKVSTDTDIDSILNDVLRKDK